MAPLVLGYLGPLVLVTWLLVTLVQSDGSNTIQELCERIRTDPKNVNLQALSPLGDQLHLIAWDILYTVPFKDETIDSVRGRVLLVGTDPGTEWTQVPWLKTLASGVNAHLPNHVLVQLTILPDYISTNIQSTSGTEQQISLLYRAQDSPVLFHIWRYPSIKYEKPFTDPYGLIHTGNRHSGPVFQFRKVSDPTIAIVMIADANVSVFPDISADNKTLVFRTKIAEKDLLRQPLVTKLPIFGFIYSKLVHLWDLENGHVILFDYVPHLNEKPKSGDYKSVPFRLVPFEEYLVCSSDGSSAPNGQVSNPSILNESTFQQENPVSDGPDNTDGSDDSGSFWIWILLLLVVLATLCASGFWFYKYRKFKRIKKTMNKSKSTQPSSSRTQSKVISSFGSTSSKPKSTISTSAASSSGLKSSQRSQLKNPGTVPKTQNKIDYVSGSFKSSTLKSKLSEAPSSESKNAHSTAVPKSKIQDPSSSALKAKSIPKSTISVAPSNKGSKGVAGSKVSSKIKANRSDLSLGPKSSTLKSMLSSEPSNGPKQ